MALYSYRIPVDDGAAPNPFWGCCTLAICKPAIRRVAQPGDGVVGLGAKKSWDGRNHEGTLVYAMRVDDVLTFDEYDQSHPEKRPGPRSDDWRTWLGDSLYFRKNGVMRQRQGGVHDATNMTRDLRGANVLVSRQFLYFGADPLPVPPEFLLDVDIPRQGHRTARGAVEERFVGWLSSLPRRWWNRPPADPQCWPFDAPRPGSRASAGCSPRTGRRCGSGHATVRWIEVPRVPVRRAAAC